MKSRKYTAWKKNRKFGDIYGGRERKRLRDNIFARAHSLKKPAIHCKLPLLMSENPGRDFFFPINVNEALIALEALPLECYRQITHLWLRRGNKEKYLKGKQPLAEFICGSGVRVIILYPWPNDMMLCVGNKKPSTRLLKEYNEWTTDVVQVKNQWYFRWELAPLRHFYIQYLLYNKVGYHVNWYREHWSKANRKMVNEFASQYAIQKTATATEVFHYLENQSKT